MEFNIGDDWESGDPFLLPADVLCRHSVIFGQPGKGKTVLLKALMEEAIIAGIPVISFDLKNELANMASMGDASLVTDKGGDTARMDAFENQVETRIWTPLTKRGLPICVDPFYFELSVDADMEEEKRLEEVGRQLLTSCSMAASSLTLMAKIRPDSQQGLRYDSFLTRILLCAVHVRQPISDFPGLCDWIRDPAAELDAALEKLGVQDFPEEWLKARGIREHPEDLLPESSRMSLWRTMNAYTSGNRGLLYTQGVPLNGEIMVNPLKKGKTPLNVVYINSIPQDDQKEIFLYESLRSIYEWMMANPPEVPEKLRLLVVIDECDQYFRSDSTRSAVKKIMNQLFSEARAFGVGVVAATQNVVGIDYKMASNCETKFLGYVDSPNGQNERKYKEMGVNKEQLAKLKKDAKNTPDKRPLFLAGDISGGNPDWVSVRWLYTDHAAPVSTENISELISDDLRNWADRLANQPRELVLPPEIETMFQGRVVQTRTEELTALQLGGEIEIRYIGGLNVLRNPHDSLYVMMGLTNALTAFTLVMLSYFSLRDMGGLSWWFTITMSAISFCALLMIALEYFLSHDRDLMGKIDRFGRPFQYVVIAWITSLALTTNWGEGLLGGGLQADWITETILRVNTIWLLCFLTAEAIHSLRMGELEFEVGDNPLQTIQLGAKSLFIFVGGARLERVGISTRRLLDGFRLATDWFSMFFLATLLVFSQRDDAELAIIELVNMDQLWNPVIVLLSLYGLLLLSNLVVRSQKHLTPIK